MKFIAQIESEQPYKDHFRKAEIVFTAPSLQVAKGMIVQAISTLHLETAQIVELYRDEGA